LPNASAAAGGNSSKSMPGLTPETDTDTDEGKGGKCGDSSNPEAAGSVTTPSPTWAAGPKVPPLKIVIPQQSASMEQEQGNRSGKNGTARHHQALPYVVASSNSADAVADKEASGTTSCVPTSSNGPGASELGSNSNSAKSDDKKDSIAGPLLSEDQRSTHHQRVLRSSHRSGGGTSGSLCGTGPGSTNSSSNALSTSSTSVAGTSAPSPAAPGSNSNSTVVDRGSNNSSPSQSNSQQQSPSPSEPVVPATSSEVTASTSIMKSVPSTTVSVASVPEEKVTEPTEQQSQSVQPAPPQPPPVDLHPRKRKMKQNKESQAAASSTSAPEPSDSTNTTTEVHPHDQPITNCYQLFLNIRKQVSSCVCF
jgi:hypothetical protein